MRGQVSDEILSNIDEAVEVWSRDNIPGDQLLDNLLAVFGEDIMNQYHAWKFKKQQSRIVWNEIQRLGLATARGNGHR